MKRTRSRKGAPGIVDVALRAGVSPATVSRFFTNPKIVKGPTRETILRAATDLGYIRDRLAGAMHHRFTGTIGLIVPTISNAIFAQLIQAFASELDNHDRTMLIAAHSYDLAREVPIMRSLIERRIDGVAVVGFDHEPACLSMLKDRDIPVLSLWNYHENSAISCVGADNQQAGELAMAHMLDLGHRDIAVIFPETAANDRARDRKMAALRAAKAKGLVIPDARILTSRYHIEEAKEIGKRILAESPPSAIVCGNDVIAQGMIFAAHALGMRVPKDVSVIGIGDFSGSAEIEPGLTTVRIPASRIGAIAAKKIIELSQLGSNVPLFREKIEAKLIVRRSTRQA